MNGGDGGPEEGAGNARRAHTLLQRSGMFDDPAVVSLGRLLDRIDALGPPGVQRSVTELEGVRSRLFGYGRDVYPAD